MAGGGASGGLGAAASTGMGVGQAKPATSTSAPAPTLPPTSPFGGQSNARPSYAMNGAVLGQPQQPQVQAKPPLWGPNALSNLPTFAQNAFNGRGVATTLPGDPNAPVLTAPQGAVHPSMFGAIGAPPPPGSMQTQIPPQLAALQNMLGGLSTQHTMGPQLDAYQPQAFAANPQVQQPVLQAQQPDMHRMREEHERRKRQQGGVASLPMAQGFTQ